LAKEESVFVQKPAEGKQVPKAEPTEEQLEMERKPPPKAEAGGLVEKGEAHQPKKREEPMPKPQEPQGQPPVDVKPEKPPEQKKSVFDSITGVFYRKEGKPAEKKPGPAGQAEASLAQKTAQEQPVAGRGQTTPAQKKEEFSFGQVPSGRQPELDFARLEKKAASEKREMALKMGIGSAIKSLLSNEVTISEPDVADLIEELELSLLEADVAYDVSIEVARELKVRLIGMKLPKGEVERETKRAIASVLQSVMENEKQFDLVSRVRGLDKPAKILFIGPNGAGKTTTMAKVAKMLMDAGLTVVFSASDTFRAAAIEQTEVHAGRLGVKVVKSKYGADPASVAFDAVSYARSRSIDVVLIDSAGRQDTNANLLDELKKINRVAKPDLKIYIGESIGGNAIIEQINAFNEAIGVDGAILTKIDCDAKGGTALSVSRATGIPILYMGIGQAYSDLVPFDPQKIAQEIMT
jgi:fused signal recognition particle receptor